MKSSDYQLFQQKNQLYQNQTRENDLTKLYLEKEINYNKLYDQYTDLVKNYELVEDERNNIKETLRNLIPENTSLRNALQEVKGTLGNIQEEFLEELADKQRIIDDLNQQILSLRENEGTRQSDLSTTGRLFISIEEKTKLQDEIQELKKERIICNQNYEQKLQKKDQLIKKINLQSQQTQNYYKELLAKKLRSMESLEEQLKQSKKVNDHSVIERRSVNQQQAFKEQIARLKSLVDQLNQQLEEERQRNVQQLNVQNSVEGQIKTNMSKQIELKEQYLFLLEQSKKQLLKNEAELKTTFTLLQSKQNQVRFKEQELLQTKNHLASYQQHISYLQNSLSNLQSDKLNLLKKLEQKDKNIRILQNKMVQYQRELQTQRMKVESQNRENEQGQIYQPTQIAAQLKSQQFYDCNNENQLIKQELRSTTKTLQNQKQKNQLWLNQIKMLSKQNNELKDEISNMKRLQQNNYQTQQQFTPSQQPTYISSSTKSIIQYQLENEVAQLKEENYRLKEKLGEKSNKLDEKNKKLQKMETQIKGEYQTRIKYLEKEVYQLTNLLQSKNDRNIPINNVQTQNRQQQNLIYPQIQELVIDDLDQQFQLQLSANRPQKQLNSNRLNYMNTNQILNENFFSQKKLLPNNEADLKSKNSDKSEDYIVLKTKYEELRVQNQSLRAHLQRLSSSLFQSKQRCSSTETQKNHLMSVIKQLQSRQSQQGSNSKQLQSKINEYKDQLQRYESLKQLLKIQKDESKQKNQKIKDLQQNLNKKQRQLKELQQDYQNLQSINEEINEKYNKTLEIFKKQMNDMNEEILKQKSNIDEKKREMKRVENDYLSKISQTEDQNLNLKSKVKKQQLYMAQMEEKLRELEEEQIQKVIITRTQLINYKQTQKRLEEIEDQISQIVKDKDKIVNEKKSLENYYEEQISVLKNNHSNQRQKLLKRLTESEQQRTQNQLKAEKFKELLQKKRRQNIQLDSQLEALTKQNYNIKLQISEALSDTNTQLIKNKALSNRLQSFQTELQEMKLSYQALILQKSKNEKERMTNTGMKVELQMAYKQIQKLNSVLMEKEKQMKVFLTQPTNDNCQNRDIFYENDILQRSFEQQPSRHHSKQYNFTSELSFGNQQGQQNYISSRQKRHGHNFKRNLNLYDPRGNQMHFDKEQTKKRSPPKMINKGSQRYIGGFPAQFCSFAPQYHKI